MPKHKKLKVRRSQAQQVRSILWRSETILRAVENLEVGIWRYSPEIDPEQNLHIGPYAEDFRKKFGLGDGNVIPIVDAFGVLFACTKALAARVATLQTVVDKLSGDVERVARQSPGRAYRKKLNGARTRPR